MPKRETTPIYMALEARASGATRVSLGAHMLRFYRRTPQPAAAHRTQEGHE